MQVNTLKRYLVYSLLFASFALSAASAGPQDRKVGPAIDAPINPTACPTPRHVQLTRQAPAAATPVLANFPTTPCSAGFEPNYGGTTINRCFRETFSFPPPSEMCCQCIDGKNNTLTLKLKVLQGGPGSTSVNDGFVIYCNGAVVTSGPLYSGSVTTGQIVTKVIQLKCGWLCNNQLNFLVQDDTEVLSATLSLDFCCVRK